MSDKINDCPFCGSSWIETYYDHVECNRCEARGPALDDWDKALRAWNSMPRLEGDDLRRQRSMWASRYLRQRRQRTRAEYERIRAERNSPEAKQARADRKWAAERAAWLARPIDGAAN